MSKLLKALLLTAAATGVAALILRQLDLDAASTDAVDDFGLPGMDPDDMPEEDLQLLLKELASQLG